ncbi:MAG: hypothetical protein WC833_08050 [Bacteroidales bacterium]|jgi:acyl carrier protein
MKQLPELNNIQEFLLEYFRQQGKEVEIKQDLFGCGALDSIGVFELIPSIEEYLNFNFTQESLRIENFRSIDSISKTIFNSGTTKKL